MTKDNVDADLESLLKIMRFFYVTAGGLPEYAVFIFDGYLS